MAAITEEPVVHVEIEAEQPAAAAAAEEVAKEDNPPPKSSKARKAAAPKEKKVPAPRKRSAPTHPPYFEMVQEAIVTLKERTGSSQYAIQKFIEDKQKTLPSNFRKMLLVQLRKFAANDKLVKVKSSYKLPPARAPKPAAGPAKKAAPAKPKAAAKPAKKPVAVKAKPKAKAAPAKTKTVAKPAAKAKPATKAKTVAKPKAVAPAKAKAAPKRKAPEKPKAEKKPAAKAARTSTRSTPRKAVAAAAKKAPAAKKAAPVKKAPAKSVKAKTVKSPAKKTAARKAKNLSIWWLGLSPITGGTRLPNCRVHVRLRENISSLKKMSEQGRDGGIPKYVRKALDHAFVGHLLQLWTMRSGRDKYQFRSVKQVMVPPRAQGSVDDIRLFKGICLDDNCIP